VGDSIPVPKYKRFDFKHSGPKTVGRRELVHEGFTKQAKDMEQNNKTEPTGRIH